MTATTTCDLCGAPVERKTGAGRMFQYRRGLDLPVPDDFEISTCTSCGETYWAEGELARLAEAQHPAFVAWQKEHLGRVVQHIRDALPKLRLRDIERGCGVTGTYLSHVMNGTKDASPMLVNLLEAYSLYPSELTRHLDGTSWEETIARIAEPGPQLQTWSYVVFQGPTDIVNAAPANAPPLDAAALSNVIPFPVKRNAYEPVNLDAADVPASLGS